MTKQEIVYRKSQLLALRDGAVLRCHCGYNAMKVNPAGDMTFGNKPITVDEYIDNHTPATVKFRGVR